jgi:hypothetical protein
MGVNTGARGQSPSWQALSSLIMTSTYLDWTDLVQIPLLPLKVAMCKGQITSRGDRLAPLCTGLRRLRDVGICCLGSGGTAAARTQARPGLRVASYLYMVFLC